MDSFEKDHSDMVKWRMAKLVEKFGTLNYDPEIAKKAMEEVHYTITISNDSAFMRKCEDCKKHLNFDKAVNTIPRGTMIANCCGIRYSMCPVVDGASFMGGVVKFHVNKPITDDVSDRAIFFRKMDRDCPECKTKTILRMIPPVSFQEICTNEGCHHWYGLMGG